MRQQQKKGGAGGVDGEDDGEKNNAASALGNQQDEVIGVIRPDVDEKPRSVANFVFSLDLASRGILNVVNSSEGENNTHHQQIAFQCTAEQAMELANSLRAAANALQRVENRSK